MIPGIRRMAAVRSWLQRLSSSIYIWALLSSRERVTRALISMGREELSSLIAEQGQADLTCQFCDKVYHYTREELQGLLAGMNPA